MWSAYANLPHDHLLQVSDKELEHELGAMTTFRTWDSTPCGAVDLKKNLSIPWIDCHDKSGSFTFNFN